MYDDNFNKIMEFIFKSEGGYNNDKDDFGGPTNYGITQSTYSRWNKRHNLPKKDVKNITKKEAMDIYYEWYWKEPGCDKIEDLREAYIVFDTAILCGGPTAKQMYKKITAIFIIYLKKEINFMKSKCKKNQIRKNGVRVGTIE